MKGYLFRHADLTKSPVCGLAMLNPLWCHMKRRLENETVLIFGRKNSTLIEVGNEVVEVKPGRMVLLPANILHQGHEPVKVPVSYWWVHFTQCMESEDENRYFLPKQIDLPYTEKVCEDSILLPSVLDVRNPLPFVNAFSELLREYEHPSFSPLVYRGKVLSLLLSFSEEYALQQADKNTSSSEKTNALVKQVLEKIEDELSNPDASVKYFASLLKVNADYLGRCFKEEMEVPLGQYIQKRRIELACSRLRETFAGVEEVALQCGYGSRRQFYDDFKKHTGKTPTEYRASSAYVGINAL